MWGAAISRWLVDNHGDYREKDLRCAVIRVGGDRIESYNDNE